MFSSKRRFNYANVTATLALVFSMSGGALAAKHYLITSTKQIKPSVLKKLTGKTGKTGPAGAPGATGKAGTNGNEGPRGPSNGYQAYKDAPGAIKNGETRTLDSLALPAGSYLASAKVWLKYQTGPEEALVTCTLTNDQTGDRDEAAVRLEKKGIEWYGEDVVTLDGAATFPASGHWIVKCTSNGAESEPKFVKIQAIQVASLSNTEG